MPEKKTWTWWLCGSFIVVFRIRPSYDRSVGSQFKETPKYLRGNIWMGIPSILMILSPILPRLDRCYISKTGSACLPRWQIIPTIETAGLHGGPKKRHPVPYCKSHALESGPINHLCRAAVYRSGRGQLSWRWKRSPRCFLPRRLALLLQRRGGCVGWSSNTGLHSRRGGSGFYDRSVS